MPGGGAGEKEDMQSLDFYWRWQVSGKMEINCLTCHDAEKSNEQAIYALQIMRQNFRWAATASSGFASVRGSARDLPDNYDIYSGTSPDQPQKIPPHVSYQAGRFNQKSEVFFEITRKIDNNRCYFCHSTKPIDPLQPERWQVEEDVHLKAGLRCVDCHRHGLDHQMIRGYTQEAEQTNRPTVHSFTCRGCHLGSDQSEVPPISGRLGAPKPEHLGLPRIIFAQSKP